MNTFRLRKYLIASLIVLSIMLTGTTFGYWYNFIGGTEATSAGAIQIGYGEAVTTSLTISPEEIYTTGSLVPTGQLKNSSIYAVEQIPLHYLLVWNESNDTLQTNGETIYGSIHTDITYQIIPSEETEVLDSNTYKHIYDLVHIHAQANNPTNILLNDPAGVNLGFFIELDEPANKSDYQLIHDSTIIINITFEIKLNDYIIDYDFTSMTMNDLVLDQTQSIDLDKWYFIEGEGLTSETNETRIFFPINQDEYTVFVEAKLSQGDGGGYGVLFDAFFNNYNPGLDNSYAFQFDRGYNRGEMIVRPRLNGSERNPIWTESANNNDYFPDKYSDPDWWSSFHEIKIVVSRLDSETKLAEYYIDDIRIGSMIYDADITDLDTYVGFRGWSNAPAIYQSLKVK